MRKKRLSVEERVDGGSQGVEDGSCRSDGVPPVEVVIVVEAHDLEKGQRTDEEKYEEEQKQEVDTSEETIDARRSEGSAVAHVS